MATPTKKRYRVRVLRTALVEIEIGVDAVDVRHARRLGSDLAGMVSVSNRESFRILEHRAIPDTTVSAVREIT